MMLENLHHQKRYYVMKVVLAIAKHYGDFFYCNSIAISEFLATKGIDISQQKVSKCIREMYKSEYLDLWTQENKAWGIVNKGTKKYYKQDNIYYKPDFKAIAEDLYQYSTKYFDELGIYPVDYSKHPGELEFLYQEYAIFCVEERRNREKRLKDLKILKSHPVHQYYEALVEEYNAGIDDYFRISYAEDLKLRASAKVSSSKNPENHLNPRDRFYGDLERFEKISQYFGTERVSDTIDENIVSNYGLMEIDVKASIYRLTYNLTHEEYLDPTVDLYENFYNETSLKEKVAFKEDVTDLWRSITNEPVSKVTVRDLVKKLSMPLYMGAQGRKQVCSYYKHSWKQSMECGFPISADSKSRYYLYKALENIFSMSIYDIVEEWYQAMRNVLEVSRFMRNQIFWYESDLYISMLMEFRKRGIKAVNVYDGFYFVKGSITREEFYEVYDYCLNKIKEQIKECATEDVKKMVKKTRSKKVEEPVETVDTNETVDTTPEKLTIVKSNSGRICTIVPIIPLQLRSTG